MVQPQNRTSSRVACTGAVRLRGACGRFKAELQDLSRTGLRVRIAREALKLDTDAGIGCAASCVQTRVGSRFIVEFEGEEGRVGLRRAVELVRLLLDDQALGEQGQVFLELGCAFDAPLSAVDWRGLPVALPAMEGTTPDEVRQPANWAGGGESRLEPGVLAGTVERLFYDAEETGGAATGPTAGSGVQAVLRHARGLSGVPLLCATENLTSSAVTLRIPADAVPHPCGEGLDAASIAVALVEEYGDWPDLELVIGTQRLWRGGAKVCEVEVGQDPLSEIQVRLVLGRRLPQAQLNRMAQSRPSDPSRTNQ